VPSERDPRTDPRPGDVLETGTKWGWNICRVVCWARDNQVGFSAPPSEKTRTIFLKSWRHWAKGATVITRGED
jgi:hypothetical protein